MLLSAEHLSINFGIRQLLDDVNFYLNEGDKTGIIGINGTGKSTFLKVLIPFPNVIANTLIVPWVLKLVYGIEGAIPYFMLTVGIGEIISCVVLGLPLLFVLDKRKNHIFKL